MATRIVATSGIRLPGPFRDRNSLCPIEKETLVLTWALEKFAEYVLGKSMVLETDHKPLVPLLGSKDLDLHHGYFDSDFA